ncbi:MAG TPA: UDP-N-acetylmuramate dehydrogenase [Candidatus Omnitrophota bacterium]|nr:UDP-N-acetylmuramate dehydrogenase [Candidatus Omnitrophota bacterium]
MSSRKILKNTLKKGMPLRDRTSFKIGGRAQYWYEPKDTEELSSFLKNRDNDCPVYPFGAGTNLLVKEGLIKKIFICLDKSGFTGLEEKNGFVKAGAGVKLSRLVSFLGSKNLGGYEFMAGIPGTVGGAVMMNAGALNDYLDKKSKKEMKDVVSSVEVMDHFGRVRKLSKSRIKFSYRGSSLEGNIILSAVLKFRKADRREAKKRVRTNLALRIKAQDWRYPSVGSFFKNPQGQAAGRLIDQCGLKGKKVGGAQVSDKHANFIINKKHAKSSDVLKLMEIIRKKVYNRFKITLEPEVHVVS